MRTGGVTRVAARSLLVQSGPSNCSLFIPQVKNRELRLFHNLIYYLGAQDSRFGAKGADPDVPTPDVVAFPVVPTRLR